jgi:hypothetical protein
MNIRPEHFKGASSELEAAKFYLDSGYQVYFPVTQQGPVDLVVDKGRLLKVQVKTATWVTSGKNQYLQVRTRLTNKYQEKLPVDLYDILFVTSNVGCWEIPSCLIKSSNLSLQNTGRNECQWNNYVVTRKINYENTDHRLQRQSLLVQKLY